MEEEEVQTRMAKLTGQERERDLAAYQDVSTITNSNNNGAL